jgi:magnesium transporter
MTRFIKKDKKEIGRSPDELIFRGNQKIEQVLLRIIDFDSNNLNEDFIATVNEVSKYDNENTVTWLNVDGLHNLTLMEEISTAFNFDQLVMAEVLDTESRPKILDYDNCTLISIKMLQQNSKTGLIEVENLSLILTKSVLITFQERKGDVFEPVRERIRKQKKRIRNGGTDYLTFALLDIVIDNYLYVISLLGEKIGGRTAGAAICRRHFAGAARGARRPGGRAAWQCDRRGARLAGRAPHRRRVRTE